MEAKIIDVILAIALALALANQASAADDYDLYEFCRRVNGEMLHSPASFRTALGAYKAAMEEFKTLGSVFSAQRRGLAKAWRAVTYDEPCSSKSLAYVHAIYACHPSVNPSQKHLEVDVRKYAKKCITPEYIGKELKANAGADAEKLFTSDLLAAYRSAESAEPQLHFRRYLLFDRLFEPKRAKALANALKRDFPQEVEQFSAGGSSKGVEKFLTKHLYKPCASYVKRVDKIMDKIEAASYYAFGEHFGRLPQEVQDALYRHKICVNFEEREAQFTSLVAKHF